ncbi:MAG: PAS domain-containing protein [Candidatus Riflebacteria bacterium]|nr:PAS domain-containing protein [Candidatus Riflebacteria bacterium]
MENPYKQYFDSMACYLTIQDRDLFIVDANRKFLSHFGEFRGRRCYQVYKHRSEKCERCPVEQAFYDGEIHRSEEQVTNLEGRSVAVLVEATPIRNEAGTIVAVMEMSTDITQIKRLENQLRASQERYRLLFEEVPCYISIQDPELRLLEANRAFREDFGDYLGRKCYEVYKHRTEQCWPCPVQGTFQTGEPQYREEIVTTVNGKQTHVLVTTAPIRDAQGRIVSVMEMSANVTQIRELESQLTSLGLLVGSVSHGLKGLLNGLSGGLYLLDTGMKRSDPERLKKGFEMAQRNSDRIRSMVSDILYYARDRVPNWEPVLALDVANEVLGLAAVQARNHGLAVSSDFDAGAGEFEVDVQAVRALLMNLLENSIDACHADSKKADHAISFRLHGLPDRVTFTIEDNGVGMDEEARQKAFSLFFSSKGGKGTGLGLFVSNRIARSHGGSIELESLPGVGTRFVVGLPRRRPPAVTGPAPAPEVEIPDAE